MSPDTDTDRPPSVGTDAVSFDRYSDVETGEGTIIVFDEDEEEAWIQSDDWVDVSLAA